MNPKYLSEKIVIRKSRHARLQGYDLCFYTLTYDWRHAVIDLKKAEDAIVEGVVYNIDENGMAILDSRERVPEGKHLRIQVVVETDSGTTINACTFISPVKDGEFWPSEEYLKVIIRGAELNQLSAD